MPCQKWFLGNYTPYSKFFDMKITNDQILRPNYLLLYRAEVSRIPLAIRGASKRLASKTSQARNNYLVPMLSKISAIFFEGHWVLIKKSTEQKLIRKPSKSSKLFGHSHLF